MDTFEAPFIALTDAIALHAKWSPEKTALVLEDQRLTWADFNRRINRVANGLLARGLRKGDTVGVLMPICAAMLEVILGTVKAGGVAALLSPMAAGDALERMIADADAHFLFAAAPLVAMPAPLRSDGCFTLGAGDGVWQNYATWRDGSLAQEPGVPLRPEDDFAIFYSSDTTGTPKGVVLNQAARMTGGQYLAIDFRVDPTAVTLLNTPISSAGTWILMLPSLVVGARLVLMPRFDSLAFLALVARERVTHAFMVPPQYAAILDHPALDAHDTRSLRVLVSAGAPLALPLKERLLARFPGALYELYGLTEGIATVLKPEATGTKLASVGTPALGTDIRIVDDDGRELPRGEIGEIVGHGPLLMRRYHRRPDDTAAAIWLSESGRPYVRTGDIGRLDDEGFLYLLDRKKDMIISGGFNVYPSDLEAVLVRHPAVADVAVIGIPHARWGETPLALVALRPDAAIAADDLLAWTNAQLGRHQRLAAIEFRPEIPRVPPLGKVPKRQLREPYWASPARD